MDRLIFIILLCGIAVVFCEENLNRQKRDDDSSDASENSIGSKINNFLSSLFGSSTNTTLNATTAAALSSFLANASPSTSAKSSSSVSFFPSTTATTTTTATTGTLSSWYSTWSTDNDLENSEEEKCYTDAILQNFCSVPSDMTDVSFWDLYSVLFSDTVVDALIIGCSHGSWCLQDRFDYWEALIVERADMVMNSEITTTMCRPGFISCINKVSNNFLNCSMYPQMVYSGEAMHLICQLKQNKKLTSECFKHTLTALHVSLADVMRKEESLEEEVIDKCDSPKVNMIKGLICVDNSCPDEANTFRRFVPWTWFTKDLEDLMGECDLDPDKCEGHLQGLPYNSDIKIMVGVSIATMVTAIMMTLAVCTCYKRHRRNTVVKEGYQQLLNDADES